jgi:hypothetical protein
MVMVRMRCSRSSWLDPCFRSQRKLLGPPGTRGPLRWRSPPRPRLQPDGAPHTHARRALISAHRLADNIVIGAIFGNDDPIVVVARVLARLNGGRGSEIPRRSRRQVRFTYAVISMLSMQAQRLRTASLFWISLSESKSIGIKSVRPVRDRLHIDDNIRVEAG